MDRRIGRRGSRKSSKAIRGAGSATHSSPVLERLRLSEKPGRLMTKSPHVPAFRPFQPIPADPVTKRFSDKQTGLIGRERKSVRESEIVAEHRDAAIRMYTDQSARGRMRDCIRLVVVPRRGLRRRGDVDAPVFRPDNVAAKTQRRAVDLVQHDRNAAIRGIEAEQPPIVIAHQQRAVRTSLQAKRPPAGIAENGRTVRCQPHHVAVAETCDHRAAWFNDDILASRVRESVQRERRSGGAVAEAVIAWTGWGPPADWSGYASQSHVLRCHDRCAEGRASPASVARRVLRAAGQDAAGSGTSSR